MSSPVPKPLGPTPTKSQYDLKPKGTRADTKMLQTKQISGGQREEGHGVVYHVQGEHHQTYLLHHYQNARLQYRQIKCRVDQMQVSHVEKNMVELSHTIP